MGKSLVVVESPAKAKTINKILGKDFVVKPCMGHVRDLPPKELGIDIEDGFKPRYVTIRGKGKILDGLRKSAQAADTTYLATDPDREGEAIAWHVAQAISRKDDNVKRILFNEITPKAVRESLDQSGCARSPQSRCPAGAARAGPLGRIRDQPALVEGHTLRALSRSSAVRSRAINLRARPRDQGV